MLQLMTGKESIVDDLQATVVIQKNQWIADTVDNGLEQLLGMTKSVGVLNALYGYANLVANGQQQILRRFRKVITVQSA